MGRCGITYIVIFVYFNFNNLQIIIFVGSAGGSGRADARDCHSGVLELELAISANAALVLFASTGASVPGDLQARREP